MGHHVVGDDHVGRPVLGAHRRRLLDTEEPDDRGHADLRGGRRRSRRRVDAERADAGGRRSCAAGSRRCWRPRRRTSPAPRSRADDESLDVRGGVTDEGVGERREVRILVVEDALGRQRRSRAARARTSSQKTISRGYVGSGRAASADRRARWRSASSRATARLRAHGAPHDRQVSTRRRRSCAVVLAIPVASAWSGRSGRAIRLGGVVPALEAAIPVDGPVERPRRAAVAAPTRAGLAPSTRRRGAARPRAGWVGVSRSQRARRPSDPASRSTIQATGRASSAVGPKFQASPTSSGVDRAAVRRACRYPASGSRTCCHGRRASGLTDHARARRRRSRGRSRGTRRSSAQSPPPIDVAGASRCHARPAEVRCGKERASPRRRRPARRRLAAAVRVVLRRAASMLTVGRSDALDGSRSTCRSCTTTTARTPDHVARLSSDVDGAHHVGRVACRPGRRRTVGRAPGRRGGARPAGRRPRTISPRRR